MNAVQGELVLNFGASSDDVCAGCGRRGHVAWLSGDMALSIGAGEAQPRVTAFADLSLTQRPRGMALLDLYLCAACLAGAKQLADAAARH